MLFNKTNRIVKNNESITSTVAPAPTTGYTITFPEATECVVTQWLTAEVIDNAAVEPTEIGGAEFNSYFPEVEYAGLVSLKFIPDSTYQSTFQNVSFSADNEFEVKYKVANVSGYTSVVTDRFWEENDYESIEIIFLDDTTFDSFKIDA